MNLFYRRAIYIFFIVAFLIISPLVILYTMGYRYNLSAGRVQKTGLMKISSIPRNADIYLNGLKYEKSQTPAKIEYLLPGDYEIRLSKDGFYDWQKKLAVYENGTTFAEKVILWKKSSPEKLASSVGSFWSVSPDENKIIFSSGTQIMLLDINSGILGELAGGKITLQTSLPEDKTISNLGFAPNSKKIIIETGKAQAKEFWLYSFGQAAPQKIAGNYDLAKFGEESGNVYALNKNGIQVIDENSLTVKSTVKLSGLKDFFVSNGYFYTIDGKSVNRLSLSGKETSTIEQLNCQDCQIKGIFGSKIIILDRLSKKIHIIDLEKKKKAITAEAKDVQKLNDSSIMFYSDWEISIFDSTKGSPELITRLGEPIISANWHPKGRHLFFSTQNKIKVIELDNRELRNIIDIVSDYDAKSLKFDRAGNNLYFNGNSGINKLPVQ